MAKEYLTAADVASFLSEKKAIPACPMCSQQMLILAEDDDANVVVASMSIVESIENESDSGQKLKTSTRRIPVVMCQCDNCSYIASFVANDIRKWCIARDEKDNNGGRDA